MPERRLIAIANYKLIFIANFRSRYVHRPIAIALAGKRIARVAPLVKGSGSKHTRSKGRPDSKCYATRIENRTHPRPHRWFHRQWDNRITGRHGKFRRWLSVFFVSLEILATGKSIESESGVTHV